MALLETRGLTVRYGGLHANSDIDLDVEAGTLVGLIGPNGAGKTTFIDAITGFTAICRSARSRSTASSWSASAPDERARLGLARTFQSLELFEDLTVRDNLLVAAERPTLVLVRPRLCCPGRGDACGSRAGRSGAGDRSSSTDVADRLPSDLSHGQRKLVSVARALAAKPKLLLLDEPAAGLDTAESQLLGAHLRDFVATARRSS